MNTRPCIVSAILILTGLAGCTTGPMMMNSPRVVASEPAYGSLQPGEILYVDDGQCPGGRLKQLVGAARVGQPRQVSCVLRR